MQRHLHPLFDNPAGAWGPPIDDALCAREERALGLRLPAALVEALRSCNGGRLRRTGLRGPLAAALRPRGMHIRDLNGVGYPEGLCLSSMLCDEWDYPQPALVLSSEGPTAFLLDYRRCGPQGNPPVIYVDTDHEVEGRVAEWTVAPDIETFLAALVYLPDRQQVLVPDGVSRERVEDGLRAIGGSGPVNRDYEGGGSLALVDIASREPGVARLRMVPTLRPDGTRWFTELREYGWLVETSAQAGDSERLFDDLESKLGVSLLRLSD